jgi:ATP synthase protein I
LVQQYWKGVGRYSSVGLEFALSILFGLFVGRWLDQKLGTHGWLSLVGAGFGLAAGIRTLWRVLRQANREADELERQERKARKDFDDEIDRRD